VAATRFDPEGMGPEMLRVTGWSWYQVDTMLFLVGTDSADIERRPAFMDGTVPPFYRLSELVRIVEDGDPDPWRLQLARELVGGVMADLVEDRGIR
jgi:hypothetical protein